MAMGDSTQIAVTHHGDQGVVVQGMQGLYFAAVNSVQNSGTSDDVVSAKTDIDHKSVKEREALLMEHLPTVRYLARRIHERLPQHVDLDDLVSAGIVGLIDAFSKFKHARNVQFKSYAQFRIRGAILDSLRTLDWSPRELRRKGRAVEEAIRSVTQRLGRAPSETEVASEMTLSLNDFHILLGDLKGLEIGSLHVERIADSGDEELAYVQERQRTTRSFGVLGES